MIFIMLNKIPIFSSFFCVPDWLKMRLLGMIHLKALPGTPLNKGQKISKIIDVALKEVEMLEKYGYDGLIVENMHDIPYVKNPGPEILTSMTSVCVQVRKHFPATKPIGVQVLAGANQGALAVALALVLALALAFALALALVLGR